MQVDGAATIRVEANGIFTIISALVSNTVQDEMLLSYTDLIALKIIPGGFPNTIIDSCWEVTTDEACEKLVRDYPDVLTDELSPNPIKTDMPMHIHVKEGAIPRKVTSVRGVPLRYEKEAEKTVNKLVKKGVIISANETTDWCSPAFFVPMGDKIRVRLVTDYTELNKHVKRPIHPFSSTKEILQAVPKNAKVFAKLDTPCTDISSWD